ncbi:hypothetical protein QOT17_011916 [Balamuthia mandrillaris]
MFTLKRNATAFSLSLLFLLSLNVALLVRCQTEEVFVSSDSSCVSTCTQETPYKSIQDFLNDYSDDIYLFSSVVFHLLPGVHTTPSNFTLGETHTMNFIGEGIARDGVSLQTCNLKITKNGSFSNLILMNTPACSSPLTFSDFSMMELNNVEVTNPEGSGLLVQSTSTLITTDVTFFSCLENAVTVSGSKWDSYGSLLIQDIGPHTDTIGIKIVDEATWHAHDPIRVLNVSRLAVSIRQSSRWISDQLILFEDNDNPVWITETSSWTQKGEVIFLDNRDLEIEHDVDGFTRESFVLLLSTSNWTCKAPVRFIDNQIAVGSSLITLQGDCRLQSQFTFVVSGNTSLFTCATSKLFTHEPCSACPTCERLPAPLPVLSWSIDPSYLRLDQNGHAVLLSVSNPVFSIRVSEVQPEVPFDVSIVTDGREGSEDVDLGEGLVSIAPGMEQTDFEFSVLAFNSSSIFSLIIRPVDDDDDEAPPKYFLSGDRSRVEVVLSQPLDLTTMAVTFPLGNPDFLLIPLLRDSPAVSSILSNFTRLVEVNGKTGEEVRSVFIEELAWQPFLPSPTTIAFFASTSHNDMLQFTFVSYEEGETLRLKGGTTLPPFDKDILKWSLLVENWNWSDDANAEDNELVLEISLLNYEGEGWTYFEEHTIQLDEEEEEDSYYQQKEIRFASNELNATLRALSFMWRDKDYETAVPVQVNVTQRPEGGAKEWRLRLAFPHFESEMEYDPDLSVVVVGNNNKSGGGDDSDDLWWKVTVPVLIVAAIVVVVVAAFIIHRVRKRQVARQHKILYERAQMKAMELQSSG